jgi:hypothetical protein
VRHVQLRPGRVAGLAGRPDTLFPALRDVHDFELPRLTRCNTVWRETPSLRVASCMVAKPSPTVSLNVNRRGVPTPVGASSY